MVGEPGQRDLFEKALLYTTFEMVSFDITWEGETPGDDPQRAASIVRPWVDAGITWWIEARWTTTNLEEVRERLRQGSPRIV